MIEDARYPSQFENTEIGSTEVSDFAPGVRVVQQLSTLWRLPTYVDSFSVLLTSASVLAMKASNWSSE